MRLIQVSLILCSCLIASFCALAESLPPLARLQKIDPIYADYSMAASPVDGKLNCVALQAEGSFKSVPRLVQIKPGETRGGVRWFKDAEIVNVDLSADEQSQLHTTLIERLPVELGIHSLDVNPDCTFKALVVLHETGGTQIGPTGFPSPSFLADLFVLDTNEKTLLVHRAEVSGSADTDLEAVISLAGNLAGMIVGRGPREPEGPGGKVLPPLVR